MKRNIFITALSAIAIIITITANCEAEEWKKKFTKKGISVYTRTVEGSSFDEFKGIGMINAPIEVCQNVLMDVSGLTKWMPDCIAARAISKTNNTIIAYNETNAPFPVSNRDVVTKSLISKEKDRITHRVTAVNRPDLVPLKSGNVRITKMNATWILIRKGQKTLAIYRVKADPGGSIPSWLANSASTKMPYKTLLGFRRIVSESKYQTK